MGKGPTIRAAGVVLLQPGKREPEVLVLHRPQRHDWSLPKGKLDPGEHLLAAARRETIEETGIDVVVGRPLPMQRYRVDGGMKTVHYWVATQRFGGSRRFEPNKEVDKIRWIPVSQAAKCLTYPRDADLVKRAVALPSTTPLVVLRHTEAVRRADFKGKDDTKRPLSRDGKHGAAGLVALLDAYGLEQIYSSDARRCLDTVRPFAQHIGADLELEPLLSEPGFAKATSAALLRVEKITRQSSPTLLCTHRPVLPDLLEALRKSLGVKAKRIDPSLSPGGFVVFHRATEGRGVWLERHD